MFKADLLSVNKTTPDGHGKNAIFESLQFNLWRKYSVKNSIACCSKQYLELNETFLDRPMTSRSIQSELSLTGPSTEDLASAGKKRVRMSSPELFEIKQLIAAGVIDKSELPDFDEESGLLPKIDSDDEDVEIELVEDEAPFLKGHGRMINDLSPVRWVWYRFQSFQLSVVETTDIRLSLKLT